MAEEREETTGQNQALSALSLWRHGTFRLLPLIEEQGETKLIPPYFLQRLTEASGVDTQLGICQKEAGSGCLGQRACAILTGDPSSTTELSAEVHAHLAQVL